MPLLWMSTAPPHFCVNSHSLAVWSVAQSHLCNMAPRLPPSKLYFIRDMIESRSLTTSEMAEQAKCSHRTIKNIRKNLRQLGSVHAPTNRVGRRRTITPRILEALSDHLVFRPGLYLDEIAYFLWDEFETQVTTSSIRRALVAHGWSKKVSRQRL
jgi:transposase